MDANYNIIYDIASVKKVNTISPTWFSIASNDGTLDSLALADYVDTAHSNHMEVWPLVDNFSENIDFAAGDEHYISQKQDRESADRSGNRVQF